MKKLNLVLTFICLFATLSVNAGSLMTKRIPQVNNQRVAVWETIIYPTANQRLPLHRHDRERVLVALTDGILKVVPTKGKPYLLKFKKDQAMFLTSDTPGIQHTDLNLSGHPIKVIIVELK